MIHREQLVKREVRLLDECSLYESFNLSLSLLLQSLRLLCLLLTYCPMTLCYAPRTRIILGPVMVL